VWRFILNGETKGLLGINRRNLNYVYPGAKRTIFKIADEKLLSKDLFADCDAKFPATLTTFDQFSDLMDFDSRMVGLAKFVIKPNRGRQGSGIMLLGEEREGGWNDIKGNLVPRKKVRKHLADIIMGVYSGGKGDRAIVEERIYAHSFFSRIFNRGLPDVRLITYKLKPVMGMLRVPTSHSQGKANLHQGGLGIGLDIHTGITTTAILKGTEIEEHPDSGVKLGGLQIPFYPEIIETAKKIAKKVPLQYIGFDFTIDESRGPMLLEMNARPGLEIQNANRLGLRAALENI